MITLPVTCKQGWYILWGLGWIGVSMPFFFWDINEIIPTWMLFITYSVVSAVVLLGVYYDNHEWLFKCKCDK